MVIAAISQNAAMAMETISEPLAQIFNSASTFARLQALTVPAVLTSMPLDCIPRAGAFDDLSWANATELLDKNEETSKRENRSFGHIELSYERLELVMLVLNQALIF